LTADQVGPYLSARRDGESDLARMFRQELFYEAWVAAVVASDDPAAVPGERDSGIGRFVNGLAAGPREVLTLPVTEEEVPGSGVRIDLDRDTFTDELPTLVPFPTGGRPGSRVRVRLLDGTGDPDHVLRIAPLVGQAGGEVLVVGNAARFDHTDTEVRYHVPEAERGAEELGEALGAARVVEDPRQTDAFDVTIVLGTDL
jgi:hypothetical protein